MLTIVLICTTGWINHHADEKLLEHMQEMSTARTQQIDELRTTMVSNQAAIVVNQGVIRGYIEKMAGTQPSGE